MCEPSGLKVFILIGSSWEQPGIIASSLLQSLPEPQCSSPATSPADP